ncbi:hypothetical protein EST38_g12946 [Candolleomyces aberdarensis]|uniref:Uncharacterized protein n=1 Tax=Candolleomyces aberdarensis TaxID=2316362 RepID=A0A4V1Q1V5_9AGAR|nr:hypothetical protein EST38_g12946 [Candolleomyces aberdarensis]
MPPESPRTDMTTQVRHEQTPSAISSVSHHISRADTSGLAQASVTVYRKLSNPDGVDKVERKELVRGLFSKVKHVGSSCQREYGVTEELEFWPVEVRDKTHPALVDFMFKNSQNMPLSLDYWSTMPYITEGTPAAFKTVCSIISEATVRLKALSLYADGEPLQTLVEALRGPANSLEHLKIEIASIRNRDHFSSSILRALQASHPPNLRHLELQVSEVFWNSHLLHGSPNITHLILHHASQEDMPNFFTFLRAVPTLITLRLDFPSFSEGLEDGWPTESELFDMYGLHPSPIQLPNLKELYLSGDAYIMGVVLRSISAPKNLTRLDLCWEVDPLAHERNIGKFFSTSRGAHDCLILPQEMRIDYPPFIDPMQDLGVTVDGWIRGTADDDTQAWTSFTIFSGSQGISADSFFPFTDPLAYKQKWSFENLRFIEVLAFSEEERRAQMERNFIPPRFWVNLGYVPALEHITIAWCHQAAFLIGLKVHLRRRQPQIPFPALRTLAFTDVHRETDRRYGYCDKTHHPDKFYHRRIHDIAASTRQVATALESRADRATYGGPLERLEFRRTGFGQGREFRDVSRVKAELKDRLEQLTMELVWDEGFE